MSLERKVEVEEEVDGCTDDCCSDEGRPEGYSLLGWSLIGGAFWVRLGRWRFFGEGETAVGADHGLIGDLAVALGAGEFLVRVERPKPGLDLADG